MESFIPFVLRIMENVLSSVLIEPLN
uniref:Uncharacterized protein n=1 Tax=Anguilla anguilla TaxID=7936 RepID=A0A0E9RID1_ANGAN